MPNASLGIGVKMFEVLEGTLHVDFVSLMSTLSILRMSKTKKGLA